MLHREPAIVAVAHVRVHAEAELVHVERQGLVLIPDVEAYHVDTLSHWDLLFRGDPLYIAGLRRRFSETAIVRLGRRPAATKHAGARPGRSPRRAARRIAPGLS